MNQKQCKSCGLLKSVSEYYKEGDGLKSICKECYCERIRKKKHASNCKKCGQSRKLLSNGSCKNCNDLVGLRECKKCKQILPLLIFFYEKTSTCKNCQAGADSASNANEESP